ncbi:DNA polymerase III subunit epsilon [Aliidongia dinghuensis]|uniref:DNA polymerase III subunit epsilon n=1 Tax=Aliidongia dinghuensis TaxID=1867774 RepID=A0A8J2YXM9_9PROT|nr:DNA polymerase III subunit epsilon [Aliidongia dinghuensis]GGF32636.1 DNA polymerase III subunit epsilon [Aliidongia dinghuensis]
MREICLDTETTGFDPAEGHRMVEIACVELVNLMPTGRELHLYFDPERDMPAEAEAVHGLTIEFLTGKPKFRELAHEFEAFMQDSRLVAHNAEFDVRFINAELVRAGRPKLTCEVQDTLRLARTKFPGSPASLDALCRRFGIDLSERSKHGALIDTRLLAKVYLELMGGQQPGLSLAIDNGAAVAAAVVARREPRPARPHQATPEELAAHEAIVATLKEAIWLH